MRRILPALAAALACAACTVPVFDPSMSLAAHTLERIPVIQVSRPLPLPLDGSGYPRFDLWRDTFSFLPERTPGGFDIGRGFVLRTSEDKTDVWYEWFDGSKVGWLQGPWSFSAEEAMPSRAPIWLKTGPYLGAIEFESEPWVDRMYANTGVPEFTYDLGRHVVPLPPDIQADLGLVSLPHIVGMSVIAQSLPAQDRVTALVRRSDTQYAEATTLFDFNGVGMWNSVMGVDYDLSTIFGNPWRLNYHRDTDHVRSFAQSYDPYTDTWTTWAWWNTVPEHAKLTGIAHRIDAVLSMAAGPGSSHLFSTEDQIGRVYRYDGTGIGELVAEFALGSLRFIGEAYVFGTWRMLFSRCLVDYQQKQLRFEIRALDTAQLLATFGS